MNKTELRERLEKLLRLLNGAAVLAMDSALEMTQVAGCIKLVKNILKELPE